MKRGKGTRTFSTALTYDADGNLISKSGAVSSTTTYTWNAKNQLTQITGANGTASFKYDALGRRIVKIVNSQTVSFVYDGAQAIAEIIGSAITTTYLTGLQIDEVLARYAGTGNKTLLTDALGSVIAQANDQQGIQNFYAYTSYGETQPLGPDDNNPIQYTGRENDATGLYYYRARYYGPVLKRFISEDPIGLAGGLNTYAYVGGNPLSYTDPSGLATVSVGASGSFFFGGVGGTVGGSAGFSTSGQFCVQVQSCARGGAGASIGGVVTVSAGTGNFCPGNSLGVGAFGTVGVGPIGSFSTNTTSSGTTGTIGLGGGVSAAGGVQICITRTFCY